MKVSAQVQAIFNAAYNEAKIRNHEYLTPEHLLYAALSFQEVRTILQACSVDIDHIVRGMETYFEQKIPQVKDREPVQTTGFQNVIERAVLQSQNAGKDEVGIPEVLVSIFDEEKNYSAYYLRKAGVNRLQLLEVISHSSIEEMSEDYSEEGSEQDTDEEDSSQTTRKSILERFTTNLTRLAQEGKLDPVIGREEEIERTIQVLCRRIKNNPIHVGEAGVGKTAITEGLAQRIIDGTVPPLLKNFTIYRLDMGSLLAGTRFRGDFEERIKRVIDELLNRDDVILYIDEIHTIIGAGSASNGTLDASNMFKPALSSGKLRCIGSTTYDEYKKFFEKDRALSRRFQKIDIEEPTTAEALEILKGLKSRYEAFHKVTYTDSALEAAVNLTALYVNDRHLPDKAIDAIDETGSWIRINAYKQGLSETETITVQESDVEKIVAKMARIPEKSVSESETQKLAELETRLKATVFGQDTAIEQVVKAIKRSRAGFRSPDKPVANFLFVGPTGVGKTELARKLAEILGITLHRFDMSEYQEKHTVSRLIGSPPGYVGYEEGGLLTDAIRKTPHAVLLLDEIEKAHPDVFNILLQIMDYATLTDNQGRRADFRNVILIMTSNAGAREIGKPLIGFGERKETDAAISDAVEKTFTPEFRNRLDAVIRFNRLPEPIIERIVMKAIDEFRLQLAEKHVTLDITPQAVRWLADRGYSEEFGARNINRLVEDTVKSWYVDEVLFGRLAAGGKTLVDVANDAITITVVP
ncbi:MAG TPA: ATP-dependent Clp protease ATP-binding subunit ClpA [Spirochaetia bacterium]|nr:ATP-dependent Clp protease ATP-binding subunit ClpA [Spirochaetales bacterium]HRS64459.1 ATP-dependent Clp protease ATP-binding subunit ClpA [Spirochaetia bacterium]HRV27323.1 ATP-dependent Clp protease ATP-binding subunit ClpA [Spirochaetia bacterium]